MKLSIQPKANPDGPQIRPKLSYENDRRLLSEMQVSGDQTTYLCTCSHRGPTSSLSMTNSFHPDPLHRLDLFLQSPVCSLELTTLHLQLEKLLVRRAERVHFGPEVVDELLLAIAVGALAATRFSYQSSGRRW